MTGPSLLLLLCLLLGVTSAQQLPFSALPTISQPVHEVALTNPDGEAASFLRLWRYAAQHDDQGPGPVIRINFEAKTILAPGHHARVNLIPQDASSPLYGRTKRHKALRRQYLMDHLVLEPLKPLDPRLNKGGKVRLLTFSGKEVVFNKDDKDQMFVNGVRASGVSGLKDGTQIYILEEILFNNKQLVQTAFRRDFGIEDELKIPLGPPLDISEGPGTPTGGSKVPSPPGGIRAPSPPFPGVIRAPAPFPGSIRAPSPNPIFPGNVRAPAPPNTATPGFVGPPAVPVGPLVSPPAPPFSLGVPQPPAIPTLSVRLAKPPAAPTFGFQPQVRTRFVPSPPASPPSGFTPLSPEDEQNRVRRQFQFPGLAGLGEVDPALGPRGAALTLPRGLNLGPDQLPPQASQPQTPANVHSIPPEIANDPLASIDRFATLFRLSGSPGDGVVATLQKEGLTTLLVLLETSGLLNYLISGENGPYILLAPSEAAFSRLPRRDLRLLSRGSDLAYHLIPLRGQPAPEVINDSTFVTSLGPELRFNVYEGAVFVNGAPVSRGDVPFAHGTIQVVESVLDVPVGDIKAVLVSSGPAFSRFNTLLSTLNLSLPDSITIFAPPDSAITSKGYSWPELLKDKDQARDLVLRHIIKGTWYTEGLLKERTLTTLAGTSVTFRKDVESSISANGVPLLSQNLTASNGVVHLAADVLPEWDVGTDPTTIPNPLLVQTEATPFPDPFSFSFDVPQPPGISGLYETPDQSSFADYSPWGDSSSEEEVEVFHGPISEAPSFEEYMMKWRESNKVPHSKVQGKIPHDNTRDVLRGEIGKDGSQTHEQFPEEPQIHSHQSPVEKLINKPENQQLIDFFALLDQNEQAPFETSIALPQIPISFQHSDLHLPPSLTGLSQTFGSGRPPQIPSLSELPRLSQLSTLAHLTNPSPVENKKAPVNFFAAFGAPIEDTNAGDADIENTILDTAVGGDNNYSPTGAPHQTSDRSCIHNHIHHDTGAANQDHHKLTNEDNLGKVNQPVIPTPTVPPTAFRPHEGLVSSPLLSFPPPAASLSSLPSSLPSVPPPSSSLPTSFPSSLSSVPPPSSSLSTSFPSPPSSLPPPSSSLSTSLPSSLSSLPPPLSSIPSSFPPPPASLLSYLPSSLPSSIPPSSVPLPPPVVPEGVEMWRPEGGVVEVEAVDVLGILDRLNLTKFRDLVDLAGLTLTLSLDGPWTVFAPTNAALDSIPHEALDQILSHRGFLRRLVSYHVAPGVWLSPQSFTPGARLPTLHAGYTLRLNYYVDGPVAQRWVAGGSVLTNLDEEATNGVVHVIDRVLYAPYGDLLTTLALSPLLTTVTSVVARDPELLELLSGPGPLTFFVPTDDTLATTVLPDDPSALREWVLSHIVEGSWYTVGFSPSWPFTSITNLTLTPQLSPQLDRVTVNNVLVTFADITASNGVIHVLQSPLITPT